MNIAQELEQKEIAETEANPPKVAPFKLVSSTVDGDYLTNMPKGSIFLVYPMGHQRSFVLMEFIKIQQSMRNSVLLLNNLNKDEYTWVDPPLFCKTFGLKEILVEGKE